MSRTRIALYAAISLLPLIAAAWIAGLDPNYLLGNYVTTSNAYVTGDLVQASAPTGGEVTKLLAQVGDPVNAGQPLAYLTVPSQADHRLPLVPPIRAPAAGTIVHVSILVGQNVAAGQSVATIADLRKLYVVAPIDEGVYATVHQEQPVDVFIPALNQTYHGTVSQLLPDLSESVARSASGAPTNTAPRSGNEVPVRIDFDYGDAPIYPGMSAQITIYVRR